MPLWILAFGALGLAAQIGGADDEPAPPPPRIELAKPFGTRSPWRLVTTQEKPTTDYGDNPAPGALHLCLAPGPNRPCSPAEVTPRRPRGDEASSDWDPHYLFTARPVYPRGKAQPPLLQVYTGSLHAGDGGQIRVTQLLRYDPDRDRFERVYSHLTGSNNNQEVRFIDSGPLRGGVVAAEPTSNAPYGYWIEVSRPTPAGAYREALKYRSSTIYNDGNALGVIDSEMPEIQRRLGMRRAGDPLPLPASKPCPRPRLKRGALWCE